jgi:dihydrofolate reductase
MRRIISYLFISLDGVVEAPKEWHSPYFDAEMGQIIGAGMATSNAMLLGRVQYEEFAAYWPNQSDDVPPADWMNGVHKYVISSTLDRVDWGPATLISGDVVPALTELKRQPGGDIAIVGSRTLAASLLRAGVLDELALLLHPIAVGQGKRLFDDGEQVPLELIEAHTLKTGVLHLRYQRASQPPTEPAAG